MIIAGAVLALIGFFAHIQILLIVGVVLLVVGLILNFVPIRGERRRLY